MDKKWFFILSIILGLTLVGLSYLVPVIYDPNVDKHIKVARLSTEAKLHQGQVAVYRAPLQKKENIETSTTIYSLDTIETNSSADALLSFDSAYRVRINPDSMITLESYDEGQTLLIIKRGDINVENFGREGSLLISYKGYHIQASEYLNKKEDLKRKELEAQNPASLTPTIPQIKTEETNLTQPNEVEIEKTLASYKPAFFRCYTQLIQKVAAELPKKGEVKQNPKGTLTVSVVIDPTGKAKQAGIVSSQITDQNFQNCIVEITKRIDFRPFKGDAITRVFPLQFQ